MENFEAQIQKLKRNTAGRTMIVTSINQEIELFQKALRSFEIKVTESQQLKQTELEELRRNALEVDWREAAGVVTAAGSACPLPVGTVVSFACVGPISTKVRVHGQYCQALTPRCRLPCGGSPFS